MPTKVFDTAVNIDVNDILCTIDKSVKFMVENIEYKVSIPNSAETGDSNKYYRIWLDPMNMDISMYFDAAVSNTFNTRGFLTSERVVDPFKHFYAIFFITKIEEGNSRIRVKRLSAALEEDQLPFEGAILLYFDDRYLIEKDDISEGDSVDKSRWPENPIPM